MKNVLALLFAAALLAAARPVVAQTPPSAAEIAAYGGLHRAAFAGDVAAIERLAAGGAALEARDGNGRTPVLVAAHARRREAMRALVRLGADPRALDRQRYDAITIASVADDVETLQVALAIGGDPKAITSPYDGTALIAAAHLGHDEVVRLLIESGAPLDHVNNLGWTALIEAVILGDGGPRHQRTARHLVAAVRGATSATGAGRRRCSWRGSGVSGRWWGSSRGCERGRGDSRWRRARGRRPESDVRTQ